MPARITVTAALLVASTGAFGQYGSRGKPASGTFDGVVHADGKLRMTAVGTTGGNDHSLGRGAQGSGYGYVLEGELEASVGQAVRTRGRPCTALFARRHP